jgi:protein SCO1
MGRGTAFRLAALGVLALVLAWRLGCSGPIGERGEAGLSSGTIDTQELAADLAAPVPAGSLTDLAGTFHDQDGRARTLAEFRGRPWVTSAVYTRCVTVCPRVVEDLRQLERAWRADTSWRGVLFSLDPAYDSPEVLRAFAAERGLSPARWTLLVPDSATLVPLARALGLLVTPDPEAGIAHTAVFAQVGADGRILDRRTGLSLPKGRLAKAWKRPAAL